MVEIVKTKLLKIAYGKSFLFSILLGFFLSLLFGVISFFFLNALILMLDLKIGIIGNAILSFVIVPIGGAIFFGVISLVITFFVNISLAIVRGVTLKFEAIE